ncbi:MAG: hypothetical protein ACI36Y_07150 [Coriobacteriales bacterium]
MAEIIILEEGAPRGFFKGSSVAFGVMGTGDFKRDREESVRQPCLQPDGSRASFL